MKIWYKIWIFILSLMKNQDLATHFWWSVAEQITIMFASPGPYYCNCQYLIFKCSNRINNIELFS